MIPLKVNKELANRRDGQRIDAKACTRRFFFFFF